MTSRIRCYTREVLLQNHAYVFVQDAEQKLVEMAHELQSVQAVRIMQLDSSLDPSTNLDLSNEESYYLLIAEPNFAARF